MAPFKPFLSPKRKFEWYNNLDKAFSRSKDDIIDAIGHGVEIFDPTRRTCLRPGQIGASDTSCFKNTVHARPPFRIAVPMDGD